METKPAFSAAVVEALKQDNYLDWSVRVKTYLMALDLWGVVESRSDSSRPENEAAFKVWSKTNAMALHVIQISCGPDTFCYIREITSARIAWETLAGMYERKVPDPSCSMASVPLEVDNIDSSTKPGESDKEGNIDDGLEISLKCDIEGNMDDDIEGNIDDGDEISVERDLLGNVGDGYGVYVGLYKALQIGNVEEVLGFFRDRPELLGAKITVTEKTALHVAAEAGRVRMVELLVMEMSNEDLEIRDNEGFTALARAICNGNFRMAQCMVEKSRNLTCCQHDRGNIPVVLALYNGHLELARYLYLLTPLEILTKENAIIGATVVCEAIYNKALGIALHLVQRWPALVFAQDRNGDSPFYALACMPDYFPSGNRLVFWKRAIYTGIHIQSGCPINEICLSIQNLAGNQSNGNDTSGSGLSSLSRLVSDVQTLLGIKHVYEMRFTHLLSNGLLIFMKEQLSVSNIQQMGTGRVQEAIVRATKEGIFEFVFEMVKAVPLFVWSHDSVSRNVLSVAVQYRRAKIFSLIYGLNMKNALANSLDSSNNNLLHMAGMSVASTSLDDIPGAALKMQRELHWFKEVGSIVPPRVHGHLNSEDLTPQQLFTKNHEDMMSKGEKWMKDTASSCSLVGALIVTIMFAAVFTVPGGNNQSTGFPILLYKNLFLVFVLADALSLFSSSISVLMFLGILTSRYAEEDFLESLPRKMIIGLSTLFFSIVAMMTTFCAALLLMLDEPPWIFKPVICFAGIPITLFVLMQFPLLVSTSISTYGPSIFDRKMERWF